MRTSLGTRAIAGVLGLTMIAGCGMDAGAPVIPIGDASTSNSVAIESAASMSAIASGASITKLALLQRNGSELMTLSAPFTAPPGLPTEAEMQIIRASLLDGSLEARIKDPAIKRLMQQARVLLKLYDAKNLKAQTAFIQANFGPARMSESTDGPRRVVTIGSGDVNALRYWTTGVVFGARRVGPTVSPSLPIAHQECYEEQCTTTCDTNECNGVTNSDIQAVMASTAAMEADVADMTAGISMDMTGYGDITIESQNCNGARFALAIAVARFLADTAAVILSYEAGPVGWLATVRLWGKLGVDYGLVALAANTYQTCTG